jgi:uncharacterized membrane protein YhiD involved in acid resistance
MLHYLATSGNGVPEGIGGILLSALASSFGLVFSAFSKSLKWRDQRHKLKILEETVTTREQKHGPLLSIAIEQGFIHDDTDSRDIHDEATLRAVQDAGIYLGDGNAGPFESIARVRERAQINEIKSLFIRARMAFNTFLLVATVTSGVLLYGAYLALAGHVASGIVVALCSAIPGTFSVGMYRLQSSADSRADKALEKLSDEVERESLVQRTFESARRIDNEQSREALEILATLRAVMPDASASELASFLAAIHQNEHDQLMAPIDGEIEVHPHDQAAQLSPSHQPRIIRSRARSVRRTPADDDQA